MKGQICFYIGLLLFLLWLVVAWYWYSCFVKGFCQEVDLAAAQTTIAAAEAAETSAEDEYIKAYCLPIGGNDDAILSAPLPAEESEANPASLPAVTIESAVLEPVAEPAPTTPETAPANPVFVCDPDPYLQNLVSYQYPDARDDIRRLEEFLNTYYKESLTVDGQFGPADEAAVRRFQGRYFETILAPQGLDVPTGQAHGATRAHINRLYCQYQEAAANQN